MPAGFRRHLVGKTLLNDFHWDIAEIRFVGKLVIIQTFHKPMDWMLIKLHDKSSPLSPHFYAMLGLYPQNGDRIVAIGSVTSLHPMCWHSASFIHSFIHCISYQRIERTVRSTEISYSTVGRSYIIDTQRRPILLFNALQNISVHRLNAWVTTGLFYSLIDCIVLIYSAV